MITCTKCGRDNIENDNLLTTIKNCNESPCELEKKISGVMEAPNSIEYDQNLKIIIE